MKVRENPGDYTQGFFEEKWNKSIFILFLARACGSYNV